MQLKLDELVRAVQGARDEVAKVEELSDEMLDELAESAPSASLA